MSTTVPEEKAPPTYINGEPVADETAKEAESSAMDTAEEAGAIPTEEEILDEHESQLDDIELQVAHREWQVKGTLLVPQRGGGAEEREFDKTYIQKPLSFTAMLQFTGLIGEKISQAMSGPEGLTIDGVLSDPQNLVLAGNVLVREDFAGMDAFVKGLAKLAAYVPDVVEECQCIWLRVPISERGIVKEIWSRSPEDGGLSNSEGTEMLEVFLAQNYREVEDFFGEQLPRLGRMVEKLRKKGPSDGVPLRSRLSKAIRGGTASESKS